MACAAKAWILLVLTISTAYGAPSPLEMPLHALPDYFASRSDDTRDLPIFYDRYGAPPDHYPAIIPDIPLPDADVSNQEYYDENATYPGIYDERNCHSLRNCPSEPDPSAPLFSGPYFASQFTSDIGRPWKCNVEVDCFGLHAIPEDLSNDTEVLFLRSFNFTTLNVGDLGVLPPLLKLRIEFTDLTTIEPGVFGSQPTLQYLEIVGNPITTFAPATFLELVDLASLELTSNQITSISREVFRGLDEVKDLKIINNNITQIEDDTFREMPELLSLNLEENGIVSISRYAFRGLPKLSTLYLNHNKVTAVPSLALRELPALINLYMTGNPIGTIAKFDFKGLDRLQELWLDRCQLTSIAKRTFQGKQIRFLVLSENKLTVVPNLGTMKRLRTVLMDQNPWHCDCEMIRTVKWLRRHSLSSASEDPMCFTPMYFKGRRALNVTYEDLCAPPPVIPIPELTQAVTSEFTSPVITPVPDDTNYERAPEDDMLPAGGWSTGVYDPQDFYTEAEFLPKPTATAPEMTTETTFAEVSSTVNYEEMLTASSGVTTDSQETKFKAPTSRSSNVEDGSGKVDATAPEISTLADDSTTGQPAQASPKTPYVPTHIEPPAAGSKFYVAVIAVVGFIILIIILIAIIFKVLIAQRANERVKKQRARQIELQNANGGTLEASNEVKLHSDENENPKEDEPPKEDNATQKVEEAEEKSLNGNEPNEKASNEQVDKNPDENQGSEETKTPDARDPDTSEKVDTEVEECTKNEENSDSEKTSAEQNKEEIDETAKEDDKAETEGT